MTPPTDGGDTSEREQGESGGPAALTSGLRSAISREDSDASFPTTDAGPTTEVERLRIENQRLREIADELRSWVNMYVERDNEKWWAGR